MVSHSGLPSSLRRAHDRPFDSRRFTVTGFPVRRGVLRRAGFRRWRRHHRPGARRPRRPAGRLACPLTGPRSGVPAVLAHASCPLRLPGPLSPMRGPLRPRTFSSAAPAEAACGDPTGGR
ncbi:hypothetical protein SXIM_33330 [Streptomyces xiamenensis]|uniref:Uncharacterized protein n=1 Tax=Streptomyces xiamenensis TaxID=408015 RepID=A0A0F7FWK2_9ACTN|nr:hypothetical protein SXIM_33330 [Streptomyces xiamenensis]